MQSWLKKIINEISNRDGYFSSDSLRFKRKSDILRILRDYGLIKTESRRGKSQIVELTFPFNIKISKFMINSSKDEFLIDTLFLRMIPWIKSGFNSKNFPYKKIAVGIFKNGHLIIANKKKGRWRIHLTHKGRILLQGYESLDKGEEHPLIKAYKNNCWFLFKGNEQIKIASHFYRCTLETIMAREDAANTIDEYGVLGTRLQNISEHLKKKYKMDAIEFREFLNIAKDFPGFVELEGDISTMDREVFITVYPIDLPSNTHNLKG